MIRVFLDTSAIVSAIEWKIDLVSELRRIMDSSYEIVVLRQVWDELKNLAVGNSKQASIAKIAITVLEKQDVSSLESDLDHTDSAILELSNKGDYVLTQDKELRDKLREKGVGRILIRQKSFLERSDA